MTTDIAYLAGFFDGEGSISLLKGQNNWPVLAVALGQIEPTNLLEFKRRWGGTMTYNSSHKTRAYWRYQVAAKKAEQLLTDLRPYLRLKAEEADAALQYRRIATSRPNPRRPLTTEEAAVRQAGIDDFHAVRTRIRSAEYPDLDSLPMLR